MSQSEYRVAARLATPDTWSHADIDAFAAALGGTADHDVDGILLATRRVDRDAASAAGNALSAIESALRTIGRTAVVISFAIDLVRSRGSLAGDLADSSRAPADLAGTAEAAEILDVGRPRIGELLRTKADFPQPLARLKSGPIWSASALRAYAATRRRTAGAPRLPRPESPES